MRLNIKFLCFYPLPVLAALFLSSCHGEYTPKPKAYPRVIYPERKYEMYDPKDCPFKFEKPVYATVTQDTVFFGQKNEREHS